VADLIEFETNRLRLRQWRAEDLEPFADLNADPRVMEFFPATLDRVTSDTLADRCRSLIAERGWGFWAVEAKSTQQFIGIVGLHIPPPEMPFMDSVEVGWRLAFNDWGQGLATEAAQGSLQVAFELLHLTEIVSYTAVINKRSRSVMEKLGMSYVKNFEHPKILPNSPLRTHCLYRLSRRQWKTSKPQSKV
jgi:RimJ/RimL family protein N-acetyltransferase